MVEETADGMPARFAALSERTPTYGLCVSGKFADLCCERNVVPGHFREDIVGGDSFGIERYLYGARGEVDMRHDIVEVLLLQCCFGLLSQQVMTQGTDCYRLQSVLPCVVSEVGRCAAQLSAVRKDVPKDLAQAYEYIGLLLSS